MKFVHHNGFKVVDIRSAGNKKVSALTVREFNTIKKFALNRKTAVPIALATIFFDTEYPKRSPKTVPFLDGTLRHLGTLRLLPNPVSHFQVLQSNLLHFPEQAGLNPEQNNLLIVSFFLSSLGSRVIPT